MGVQGRKEVQIEDVQNLDGQQPGESHQQFDLMSFNPELHCLVSTKPGKIKGREPIAPQLRHGEAPWQECRRAAPQQARAPSGLAKQKISPFSTGPIRNYAKLFVLFIDSLFFSFAITNLVIANDFGHLFPLSGAGHLA